MNRAEPLVQASLVGEAIDDGPVLVVVFDDDMNYVAVNRYAADVLGYTREELLRLTVPDVARYDAAPAEYAEMLTARGRTGTSQLTCKDGTELTMQYVATETRLAGMLVYVVIGWPERELAATPTSPRRRAPARAPA